MADTKSSLADLTVSDVMRTEFPTVRPDEPCSRVASIFAEERATTVVLTDEKGRYKGFVSERDVLRSKVDPDKTDIESVLPSHAMPTMRSDDRLVDAAGRILDANARGVAVLDKDEKVIGILVREDIIAAAGADELGERNVADFMTSEVVTGDAEDSVAKALSTMRQEGISHLPVIEDGQLAGIVTVHDILRRVIAPMRGDMTEGWKTGEQNRPLAVPLGGVLTTPVISLPRGSTYAEAADLIAGKGIGSVVITKDSQFPYGIVTRRDLLEPVSLLAQEVPTIVVHFSSKDTSRDGYETSGAPAEIRTFLSRYDNLIEPGILLIHAKRHKDKNRGVDLWHIRLNLTGDLGKFYAVGEGWGMAHATRLAVDHLERKVRRAKEELLEHPSREFIEEHLY